MKYLKNLKMAAVEIGDKIWASFGIYYVVGNVVDASPNKSVIFVSKLDLERYRKQKEDNAVLDGNWYKTSELSLIDFEQGAGIKEIKKIGFAD